MGRKQGGEPDTREFEEFAANLDRFPCLLIFAVALPLDEVPTDGQEALGNARESA